MTRSKIPFILLLGCWLLATAAPAVAQKKGPYNPRADARAEIAKAVHKAKAENKHVLLQIGGNWCVWCRRLEKLFRADTAIARILNRNYELVFVNFSRENKNLDVLAELGYPQRFGFPVLVVLDADGKRLHTQDSALLEKGKGQDPEKVRRFLELWTPSALDPAKYRK